MRLKEKTSELFKKKYERRISFYVRQITDDTEILVGAVDLERTLEIKHREPNSFRNAHGYYKSAKKLQEIEDLSFLLYLPPQYKIVSKMIGSPEDRWKRAVDFRLRVEVLLKDKVSKPLIVDCRAKSNFSIWLKMHRQDKDADEIYDQIGIRIVADSLADARNVIDILKQNIALTQGHEFRRSKSGAHNPERGSLKQPKESGYASIHLTCFLEDIPFDIHVTTRQLFINMHEKAPIPAISVMRYKTQ